MKQDAVGGAPGRASARRGFSAFPCCKHCGHFETGEAPGHEYPCRTPGCHAGNATVRV